MGIMAESARLGVHSCGIPHPIGPGATDTWLVVFDEYVPAQEGSGSRSAHSPMATGARGAPQRSRSPTDVHYPGTYFAGVYDVVDWISMVWRCLTRRW